MSLPKYKIYRTGDKTIDLNLDSMKAVLDALTNLPQKLPLTKVVLTTGLNLVPHTLGKPLTGWALSDVTSQVALWRETSSAIATLPNIYLYLNASAPAVISLEVW